MSVHAGTRRPSVRFVAGTLVAVAAIAGPACAGIQDAIVAYRKAEASLERGDTTRARKWIDRAIREEAEPTVYWEGNFKILYLPYYLRGRIHLADGRLDEARADFEAELGHGLIQQDAAEHEQLLLERDRLQGADRLPPVLASGEVEILSTEFVPSANGLVERVGLRVTGVVVDEGGVDSVRVGAAQATLVKSDAVSNAYEFSVDQEVDAPSDVVITVTDHFGHVTRETREVPLPELRLGSVAKRIHAVVVGVDHLESDYLADDGSCSDDVRARCAPAEPRCYTWGNLGAAVADARRLAQMLLARGVPEANVDLLVSDGVRDEATYERVNAALQRLRRQSGEKAIFFFSGHGVHSRSGENLMILSDTRGYECAEREGRGGLDDTAITVSAVYAALEASGARERYLILDACRTPPGATRSATSAAAPGFKVRGLRFERTEDEHAARSIPPIVLYATQDAQVSTEWSLRNAGYFSWYLTQGLRLDLPLRRLEEWVQDNVRRQTRADLCARSSSEDCSRVQSPYFDYPRVLREETHAQRKIYPLRPSSR